MSDIYPQNQIEDRKKWGGELQEIAEERAEDAAQKYGFILPDSGSIALEKLVKACLDYAQKVDFQNSSPLSQVDERVRTKSDQARRMVHNDLCIKLLGVEHQNCSVEDRIRVSNFAVMVAGTDHYIDSF